MSNNIVLKIKCPICGKETLVQVQEDDFQKYKQGCLAQEAFPYLTKDEREVIISGICFDCQKNIFN